MNCCFLWIVTQYKWGNALELVPKRQPGSSARSPELGAAIGSGSCGLRIPNCMPSLSPASPGRFRFGWQVVSGNPYRMTQVRARPDAWNCRGSASAVASCTGAGQPCWRWADSCILRAARVLNPRPVERKDRLRPPVLPVACQRREGSWPWNLPVSDATGSSVLTTANISSSMTSVTCGQFGRRGSSRATACSDSMSR